MEARQLLDGLVGRTLRTVTGRPNQVPRLDGDQVIVGTERSPGGEPVPIQHVRAAFDVLRCEGEIRVHPDALGHRRSFIGAVLLTLAGATALSDPTRVRLAESAGALALDRRRIDATS